VPGQAGLGDPRPHQHRLPAPRRRRYLNDAFRFGQSPVQRAPGHDSSCAGRSGRNIKESGLVARRHDAPERPDGSTVTGPVKTGSERSQVARDNPARG
jgi:hypothetical protein